MTEQDHKWIGYVGPMVVFGLFTSAEGLFPASLYPVAYAVKIAAVTAALVVWRETLKDIRPSWSVALPSVVVGLLIAVVWVAIDETVAYPHLGDRIGFDPFGIQAAVGRLAFLAVRLYGLILVVPIMEELFWRSFLLRALTSGEYLSVPIGRFSLSAFGIMVLLSSVAHTEWLVAAIASCVFAWWLRRTGSLFATVVAHAAANAALGVYILTAHDWKYW